MIQQFVQQLKRIPPAVMTFVTGVPALTAAQKARLVELDREAAGSLRARKPPRKDRNETPRPRS